MHTKSVNNDTVVLFMVVKYEPYMNRTKQSVKYTMPSNVDLSNTLQYS